MTDITFTVYVRHVGQKGIGSDKKCDGSITTKFLLILVLGSRL